MRDYKINLLTLFSTLIVQAVIESSDQNSRTIHFQCQADSCEKICETPTSWLAHSSYTAVV